jgi:hypothetical protein
MEADGREPGLAGDQREVLADVPFPQRAAVLAGEHPAGVGPARIPLQPLHDLPALPCLQHLFTASVTLPAGTTSPDTLNDNGSASTPSTTYAPLWATTYQRGQEIMLDPAGKLYAAIIAVNAAALQLVTPA